MRIRGGREAEVKAASVVELGNICGGTEGKQNEDATMADGEMKKAAWGGGGNPLTSAMEYRQ